MRLTNAPVCQYVVQGSYSAIWVILLCTMLIAAETKTAKVYSTVIKPVTPMYRTPSADSEVVSEAIWGKNIVILEAAGEWSKVQTEDEYTGWARTADLKPRGETGYATSGNIVRVSQLSANVYREPDVTIRAPIARIPWESQLEVLGPLLGEDQRWIKVLLPDGSEGHVQRGDVTSDFSRLSIEQTIATAKRFLGTTYTWGGTSSFGYDCSGFVQMLVRQRGIVMPRDADQQSTWNGATPVQRGELQAGDLLYFGENNAPVTHTGMYIGNGEFIHATTHEHPIVQISKLDDQPWTKLLVGARRVKP